MAVGGDRADVSFAGHYSRVMDDVVVRFQDVVAAIIADII
jgi:hypothetical protein